MAHLLIDSFVDFIHRGVNSKFGCKLFMQTRIRNNDGYKFVEERRFNPYSPFFYILIISLGIVLLIPHGIPEAFREAIRWREFQK
jgi:hypothetical protein